ncbi:MAG: glycosyltransferase family 2 protein [Phycisphaerae bacterium]
MPEPRFLLAIPVYNEAPYVRSVLAEVRRYVRDILVVDDGSTDATPAVLAGHSGLEVIRHAANQGYGQSLSDAFAYAISAGYDWLITLDCDEQHEPSFIPAFMRAARADEADIISGSRYLEALDGNSSPPEDRRRINAAMTQLLNQRLGLGITDAFCGFKAYRVTALTKLSITEAGYAMPLQMWVQIQRAGLRIQELPVKLIYTDATRLFGGPLDDPETRYQHYLQVLEAELARPCAEACCSGSNVQPAVCG